MHAKTSPRIADHLYRLSDDPHEARNVIHEHPEVAARMHAEIEHTVARTRSPLRKVDKVPDEIVEQLRKTGCVYEPSPPTGLPPPSIPLWPEADRWAILRPPGAGPPPWARWRGSSVGRAPDGKDPRRLSRQDFPRQSRCLRERRLHAR